MLPGLTARRDVAGGLTARRPRLLGHVVHQVVDVEHIARGKHAGYAGLQALVHGGAVGDGVELHPGGAAQLVLRDQAAGQQQGVALIALLRARDGPVFPVHLGDGNRLHPLFALDVHHRMAQLQGDAVVVQALDDVPLQPAGIGHQLRHHLDLGPLQGHAAGHDEPDIAGAQDDHLPTGHIALHIHQPLGGARGVDARRAAAGYAQRAPGPLPAAHGQDDRLGVELEQPVLPVHGGDGLIRRQIQHHGVQLIGDAQLLHLLNEPPGILGAGELLLKGVQAEAVVNALVQDAAQLVVPLQDEDIPQARLVGRRRSSQPRRAAADDDKFVFSHGLSPSLRWRPC